MQNHQTVRKN